MDNVEKSAIKFLSENKKVSNVYRGKLTPWKNEILFLRNNGMTYGKIVEYLKTQNLTVSINAVRNFCVKHIEQDDSVKNKQNNRPNLETTANNSQTNETDSKPIEQTNNKIEEEKPFKHRLLTEDMLNEEIEAVKSSDLNEYNKLTKIQDLKKEYREIQHLLIKPAGFEHLDTTPYENIYGKLDPDLKRKLGIA